MMDSDKSNDGENGIESGSTKQKKVNYLLYLCSLMHIFVEDTFARQSK